MAKEWNMQSCPKCGNNDMSNFDVHPVGDRMGDDMGVTCGDKGCKYKFTEKESGQFYSMMLGIDELKGYLEEMVDHIKKRADDATKQAKIDLVAGCRIVESIMKEYDFSELREKVIAMIYFYGE